MLFGQKLSLTKSADSWQAAVTHHGVFAVPSIQFFAVSNGVSEKCPAVSQGNRSVPWRQNMNFYYLVGSSNDTEEELRKFVSSILTPGGPLEDRVANKTVQEAKLTSRSVPANLLEQNWENVYQQYRLSLDNANGSKQAISPHELVRDRVITYHHRVGLNYVLSEARLLICQQKLSR